MPWLDRVTATTEAPALVDLCGPTGCAMPDLHTAWHARQYPAGSVWVCDSCGRSWELVAWEIRSPAEAVPEWVPTGDRD